MPIQVLLKKLALLSNPECLMRHIVQVVAKIINIYLEVTILINFVMK
ncbi:MAG: hypothetical protein ACD_11C00108G0038 [uncultured bacterium]|nr:MAG: hypothetical protein ACD_11C00108G0038 [uncultured bacterium]